MQSGFSASSAAAAKTFGGASGLLSITWVEATTPRLVRTSVTPGGAMR